MLENAVGSALARRASARYRLIEPRGGSANLGEGAYGIVYKAQDMTTGEMVALKKIRLETEADGISSSTLREITLLMQLNHENVVRLQNVSLERERMSLVFELLELDLRKYLDGETEPIPLELVQSFAAQLLSGLTHCHSMGVMHRDLKPHNILLSQREGGPMKLKIADFGLARTFSPFSRPLTMEVITRWYRAPEVILGHNRYTCAVDLWSIGCIIAEISNKRALFMGDCDIDQLYKIFRCLGTPTNETWQGVEEFPYFRSNFPQWPSQPLEQHVQNLPETGVNLLRHLFAYNPQLRLTAKDALRHPFVFSFVSELDLTDPYQACLLHTPTTRGHIEPSSMIYNRSISSTMMFHSASSAAIPSSSSTAIVATATATATGIGTAATAMLLPRVVHKVTPEDVSATAAPAPPLQSSSSLPPSQPTRPQFSPDDPPEAARFISGGKMSRTFLPIGNEEGDEEEEEEEAAQLMAAFPSIAALTESTTVDIDQTESTASFPRPLTKKPRIARMRSIGALTSLVQEPEAEAPLQHKPTRSRYQHQQPVVEVASVQVANEPQVQTQMQVQPNEGRRSQRVVAAAAVVVATKTKANIKSK